MTGVSARFWGKVPPAQGLAGRPQAKLLISGSKVRVLVRPPKFSKQLQGLDQSRRRAAKRRISRISWCNQCGLGFCVARDNPAVAVGRASQRQAFG
jgi:hypothetical protein